MLQQTVHFAEMGKWPRRVKRYRCAAVATSSVLLYFLLARVAQQVFRPYAEIVGFDLVEPLVPLFGDRKDQKPRNIIFHVSRECESIASFGGLGKVVGALSSAQSAKMKNSVVAVILPKYKSVRHKPRVLARLKFRQGRIVVQSTLHHIEERGVGYFFISPPSTFPQLWSSHRPEDIYVLPRFMKVEERDIYFSRLAANTIVFLTEQFSKWSGSHTLPRTLVHIHGATNSPTSWFLRDAMFRGKMHLSVMYTMHDYNSEPFLLYDRAALKEYGVRSRCRRANTQAAHRMCDDNFNQVPASCVSDKAIRPPDLSVGSANFGYCVDVITTVSHGMVHELLHNTHTAMAELMLEYSYRNRLVPITNWISNVDWLRARAKVPERSSSTGKLRAKQEIFSHFRPHRFKGEPKIESLDCVILWLGRFESNKGVQWLQLIHASACHAGCTLFVSGQGISPAAEKLISDQLGHMERSRMCPFYFFGGLEIQHAYGSIIRAASDLVIIPSASEAYGLVAAEALAYGAIPIVSLVGGLPEVIVPYPTEPQKSDDAALTAWTGFAFEFVPTSGRLIALSMTHAIEKATGAFWSARESGLLQNLQTRLISSAPKEGDSQSVDEYIKLAKSLLADLDMNYTKRGGLEIDTVCKEWDDEDACTTSL